MTILTQYSLTEISKKLTDDFNTPLKKNKLKDTNFEITIGGGLIFFLGKVETGPNGNFSSSILFKPISPVFIGAGLDLFSISTLFVDKAGGGVSALFMVRILPYTSPFNFFVFSGYNFGTFTGVLIGLRAKTNFDRNFGWGIEAKLPGGFLSSDGDFHNLMINGYLSINF